MQHDCWCAILMFLECGYSARFCVGDDRCGLGWRRQDRRSYSGIAVWVKGSAENTWYPVYASSKKQNVVCLSSGESELMALVGGACEGIATRDQWSKMCNCFSGYYCLVHGQCSSSGFRETKRCKSTDSSRGHENLLHAGLGNGTWTTHLEGAW